MNRTIILIEKFSWLLPLVLLFGLLVLMLATLHRILAEIRLKADARYLNIPAMRSPGESTRRRIDRTNGEIGAFGVALGTHSPGTLCGPVIICFISCIWI
jgi:hypothetical protein